jgi:hypothetical protein
MKSFETYIKHYDYTGLLNYTNQILNNNNNNRVALEYKAKALISLLKYKEAHEILSQIALTPTLQNLARLTKALLTFGSKYQKYSQMVVVDDHKDRILNEIDKFKGLFLKNNNEYTEKDFESEVSKSGKSIYSYSSIGSWYLDLHRFAKGQNHEVYILGPHGIVKGFDGYDDGTYWSFRSKLIFLYAQALHDGWIFTKEQNFLLPYGQDSSSYDPSHGGPICLAPFPRPNWVIDDVIQKDTNLDVFYSAELIDETTHRMVEHTLDNLAKQTKDYFVPMYHNIIDPNMTSVMQDDKYQWTATEFIIDEVDISVYNSMCSLQLCLNRMNKRLGKYIIYSVSKLLRNRTIPKAHIASPISNIPLDNVELYVAAEEVLNSALPLLGKLTKPALLLPGRLQAVVKAQRIYLKPGEEYDGVWHRDGLYENIVAVVIYYYRVSDKLEGGDLEFIDKRPIKDVMGLYGDCDVENFTSREAEETVKSLPHCRMPVKKGTLVVFSNYQSIHRVLKMTSNGEDPTSPDGHTSRDFLLFFIVDQSKPLLSSNSDLNIKEDRKKVRVDMFKEQMEPSGVFAPNTGLVCSTGNGCLGQIGWLDGEKAYDFTDEELYEGNSRTPVRSGFKNIEKMNEQPPLNRGLSWAFDEDEYQ